MADIPKELFDYAIQSQIATGRYSNQVAYDILALLNDADAEILAKLEKLGDSKRFTPARLRALLKEIRQMVSESYAGAHEQIKGDMAAFADHVATDTVELLATQAPVAYNVVRATAEQLESIVSTVPVIVGPKKKLLLEEIFSSLAAGKEEDIRGAIRLGMVQGESIPDLVKRLRGTRAAQYKDGVLNVSRRHAETMCRTITNSVGNQAAHAVYVNNSAVVKGHTVIVALDGRVCGICWPYSGKSYPLNDGPSLPQHCSCRCYYLPQTRSFKELGVDIDEMPPSFRASSRGLVQADISFPEWFKGTSEKEQRSILGAKRYQLYTDGKMPLKSFVDSKNELYSLDELKEKNRTIFNKVFGA